jgi:hypothetical protein
MSNSFFNKDLLLLVVKCSAAFIVIDFYLGVNILILGTVKSSPFKLIPLVNTSLGYNIFGWFPYFGKT